MKRVITLALLILVFLGLVSLNRNPISLPNISNLFKSTTGSPVKIEGNLRVVNEESTITSVVDKVSPSVVTVSIVQSGQLNRMFGQNSNDPFNLYFPQQQNPTGKPTEQDIGTGFIITSDGLIITNKHVVSDTSSKYKVITKDDKTYNVDKIYRDPSNDLAILKIDATGLTPIEMGDSSKIKVGQMAIAIGTALGEFRNTVTVGVISGLGRGITAGSPLEGSVERLDNVIQTDAAINPGNSGGPLLNSAGQAIGINTAVSQEGQNLGFAIPINVIKDAIDEFNKSGGKFSRPFLGVEYRMITRDLALLNEVPEGAYVQNVVSGSPAEKAGIENGDIITKIDGNRITDGNGGLSKAISDKKVGDAISIEIWRDGSTKTINTTVGENTGE